jgi:hypothetical protein
VSRIALASLLAVLTLVALPAATTAADLSSARAKAVSWAVSQAGHREDGTSNCSSRIRKWQGDMGLKVPPCRPWCGALLHQAFARAGVKLSARLIDPDRSYEDAVAGRRGLRRIAIEDVRKGDLLFFAFRPRLKASHIALVRGTPSGGKVRTVEGNVAHAVRLQSRGLRYAVLAARVSG